MYRYLVANILRLMTGKNGREIHDLQTLNRIAESLNRAVDVKSALNNALAQLIDLMGLETGWIFLRDNTAQERWAGRGYVLAAHRQLPPALAPDNPKAWDKGCDCQTLCRQGRLSEAYNEVHCSRLASAIGDRRNLVVHASTPLRAGDQVFGILNVAATAWAAFDERSLALLTNVGSMMGVALERARLYDLMQEQRIHEQAMLLEVSNQLLSRLELDDLLDYLVSEVRQLLNADACAVLLPARPGKMLTFQATSGWRTDPVANAYEVPMDARTGSGRVMQTQRPLLYTRPPDGSKEDLSEWRTDWLEVEDFYTAAILPLLAEGRSIGVLVINMRSRRQFDPSEIRFLQVMANQAAIAIERARLRQEELERHRLEKELSLGRQIQMSMLPPSCPYFPGWDMAAMYEPARQVGGDFYDFFTIPGEEEGRLGLVIADVSDKGVPAALFMALCRTIIRNNGLRGRPPADALVWANRFIQEDSQTDMFLSAFYGVLDTNSGAFTFANAGHNPPLWWCAERQAVETLTVEGMVLGVLDTVTLAERTVHVQPGDVLILYTDGITEAVNAGYVEFGEARLHTAVSELLASRPDADGATIMQHIVTAVHEFTGGEAQHDDMTLVVVRRLPGSPA